MLRPHSDVSYRGDFKHTNYRQYSRYVLPFLDRKHNGQKVESICIFREPIDQMFSWYRYRSREELANDQQSNERSTAGRSFEEFVEAFLLKNPPIFARVPRQFAFIRSKSGEVGVDRVFRYDQIDDFVTYLSERIGTQLTLPHRNVSPTEKEHKELNRDLSEGVANRLAQKLKKDIEFYESLCQTSN